MRLLHLVITGSKLHNTSIATSDTDVKGIGFAEVGELLGLEKLDQEKVNNGKLGTEKIEGVIETVERQINFIYKGDLSGTETCFADDRFVVWTTPLGKEICEFSRNNLLCRKLFKSYSGYFLSQLRKLDTSIRIGGRAEDQMKYGYDRKMAMHAYRLGKQALNIMRNRTLNPTLDLADSFVARALRAGEYDKDYILTMLGNLDVAMKKAYDESTLRDEVDFQFVNNFVIDLHVRYIKGEFDSQFILPVDKNSMINAIQNKARQLNGIASAS